MRMTTDTPDYVLGASDRELARLDAQAEYYRPITLDAMRWAGIRPGMRVLDLGSGTGAVAFAAAEIVGPTGRVLGIDKQDGPVRSATANAATLGLPQVSFVTGDLETWTTGERFDAITGRLIAMYLPDPAATIGRLTGFLEPGGILLLQEFSMSSAGQVPETPLFRRSMDAFLAAFRAVGAPTDLGRDLDRVFVGAGLPVPTMLMGSRWERGHDARMYTLLAGIVRTLLPVIVGHGIATEDEIDIDTLEDRLRAEGAAADAGGSTPQLISAWAAVH
jgi:SAM-dependent methyltransferase